jgi:diguanylate cyclase (GGDEF)-like protein
MTNPSASSIDRRELLDRLANDQELARESLTIFQSDVSAYQESLRVAVENKFPEDVRKSAHAFKGMLANLAHDALTSLWNCAVILYILQREITRSTRDQSKGVIAVIADIDHFKKINDTYGHAVGDAVLREAAHRLNAAVRSYDAVARYGGEEFIAVLVGCPSSLAISRSEHLRKLIDSRPFDTAAGPLKVSMSLGVAGTDDWNGLTAEQLIHQADVALYRAKETGRNGSVLALPSRPQNVVAPARKETPIPAA